MSVPRLLVEAALAGEAQTASERRAMVAEFLATRRLLARVSNNVNQLAAAANATGEVPAELRATMHAVARVTARLDASVAELTRVPPARTPELGGQL
ncbi:MobC family plasmid mobilization relaxosome protein [Actinomadura sp. B10D3]|uniref:MobC family plasmid mobilization relaxosome protein n=1 Tax=Actinomadura sp. B10D3 TaxID=3153557 RepID=UPI00325EAA56